MSLRALAFFAAATTVGVYLLACQSDAVTSRDHGVLHGDTAVVRAQTSGTNHRWDVDVALRDAPAGTYALLFSANEPGNAPFVIAESDPKLKCPTARARGTLPQAGCVIADHGEVVGVAHVGVGGAGALRAAFDNGGGGYFTIVRATGPEPKTRADVPFDVQIVSEALTKDDEAHRFTIEQSR